MKTNSPIAAATALIVVYAATACVGKAETMQDLINEGLCSTHYPFLPPCGREITLEELNSRLQYKLKMMKAEDEQMKAAMSTWQKLLGILYVTPTQTVWNSNKKAVLAISTDLTREQVSKAIDAQGTFFLATAHGDPNLVRKNILVYLMINGWDKQRIEVLQGLQTEAINPTLLFHVD